MPTGVRPRVNEAREFLEIAKDFKDPREIIREALSNSWDAGASKVAIKFSLAPIAGTKKKKIITEISDDGSGMDNASRPSVGCSEIEGFFNLGDSGKPFGSIGSKGHGTKIYYKSNGLRVSSWKNGSRIDAETEVPPWETLNKGVVPTYRWDQQPDANGKGTSIVIDGFQAKQSEFSNLEELIQYIKWYTVAGSFGQFFGSPRKMAVEIKPLSSSVPITLEYGFNFPSQQIDLGKGTEHFCKIFGPKVIDCGSTEDGKAVNVEIVGALLGEEHRGIVPETYTHMGLWLCKDYIRVERNNKLLEDVLRGQYYYRSLLIFANCQSFDLTANRNNIRQDNEEYDLAIKAIKDFCANTIWGDADVQSYFAAKKQADEVKDRQEAAKRDEQRRAQVAQQRQQRLNIYNGRASLVSTGIVNAPVKEPQNEAETALLLQAMISSKHPGIDFRVGDYSATQGVDLIVEQIDKGIPTIRWGELVWKLEKLFQWSHPAEGIHIVVCYELGKVGEHQKFTDGQEARLVHTGKPGRYALMVNGEAIDVYVLRDLLTKS